MSVDKADWDVLQRVIDHLSGDEKLDLITALARSLKASTPADGPGGQSLDVLRRKIAALPVHNPEDGFTNREHDAELYGGQHFRQFGNVRVVPD